MSTSFILDIIIILILLTASGYGAGKGLIRTAQQLVSIIAGYLGAWLSAFLFSKQISELIVLPWVQDLFESTSGEASNPISQALEEATKLGAKGESSLAGVFQDAGIPYFSFSGKLGPLIDKMTGTGTDLLSTSSRIISQRIAFVLIFLLTFFVIQLIVMLIFQNIEGLTKLPLMTTANHLGGGACGFLLGILVLSVLMWIAATFVPAATAGGGILSNESLEASKIAQWLFQITKML